MHTHTHTHTFNGPLSRTTRVSQHQKGETNLDFTEARDSERQWHQLDQMTTPALHHSFFYGWIPFLLPNQQRHSTEGKLCIIPVKYNFELHLSQRIHNTVFF